MKIAIATLMRDTGDTGVQTQFNALKRGLQKAGHEVLLINSFSSLRWLSYPVYAVRRLLLRGPLRPARVWWYRYWHYLFLYFALNRRVLTEGIDVVAAQCPLSAKAALKVRSKTGKQFRIVWTCHFYLSQAAEFEGRGELRKGGSLYKSIEALEREMLQSVDCVTFVSEHSRRAIVHHSGVTPACSHVIFNGLESPSPCGKLQRKDLGLQDDAFVIVSVGALEPNKNQYAFVQMLSDMLLSEQEYQVLLVGEGKDRGKIEAYVRERGLQDRVILLGQRNDVHEILPLCDLYCHPSKMESFGLAVAEAMSHGLPVIVAPVGGIPEFVKHNQSGLLIECTADNKADYLEAIRRLMQSQEDHRRLSKGAKQVFEVVLTLKTMTDEYEAVFNTMCPMAASSSINHVHPRDEEAEQPPTDAVAAFQTYEEHVLEDAV